MTMAVEIPTDRDTCWWEEAIITTRLRFAAGICVLSAGLFVGSAGGAIAAADTESTGSAPQSQSAEGPSTEVGAAAAPAKKVAHPLRTTLQATVQGVASTLRSIRKFGQQHSATPDPGDTELAATNTVVDPEASAPAVDPSAAVDPNVFASSETEVVSETTPPATDPLAPMSTVVEPVRNAVATVATVVGSVPAAVMALPTSPTPVTDAITTVQEMLTSVTNAVVPLAQIPGDLYTMLSVQTVTATTTIGGGVIPGAAPVLANRATQSLQSAPIVLTGGMALPAAIVPVQTFGDIELTGLSNVLPASGIASPLQDVFRHVGIGSFLEHTVSALFVPASLSALAAVALPGVGGLLIICALGMRIGYRQAKALFEVRRAGIAAFAGPGPLGVVRSGSLIALHSRAAGVRPHRALRVVRPATSGSVSSEPRHLAAS